MSTPQPPATSETNTHTLYTHLVRRVRKANEDIAQTRQYLDPDSPNYLPTYIQNLEAMQASDNPPEGIENKLATMRQHLQDYRQRAAEAEQVLAQYPAQIRQLEQANEVFRAPSEKQAEYLYVMDEESCKASCIDWESVAANPGADIAEPDAQSYRFKNKQDIALTEPDQTDAVRIWNHHSCVEDLCITDERHYDKAHRDAIQLIPPPLGKYENGQFVRLADQMAGSILDDVTVKNCAIHAPHGPLQGIFASDGLQRNLKIIDNSITAMGAHAISIAGLLDGGEISGNVLKQVSGGERPEIRLYPARIGGNMADDGIVSVLSFAAPASSNATDKPALHYGPVTVAQPNQRIQLDGSSETAEVQDLRHILPDNFLRMGVGLTDFDYDAYLDTYSRLTLAEYRDYDAFGAEQLEKWLTQRCQAFSEGRAEDHPLGAVSEEQEKIGERFLKPALTAWQDGSADELRLVDLEYTAIRSFTMKRLAIMHGTVEPLANLALANERREHMLRFLLPAETLQQQVNIGFVDADMVCVGSEQGVPSLRFNLYFAPDEQFNGQTDGSGHIALQDLPLGPYIMQLEQTEFSFGLKDITASTQASDVSSAASLQAKALLADLRRKVPVLESYLSTNPQQEVAFLDTLAQHLQQVGIETDSPISAELRRDCLSLLGYGKSRREPFRETATIHLNCPQTNAEQSGCLFFWMKWLRVLLGR